MKRLPTYMLKHPSSPELPPSQATHSWSAQSCLKIHPHSLISDRLPQAGATDRTEPLTDEAIVLLVPAVIHRQLLRRTMIHPVSVVA